MQIPITINKLIEHRGVNFNTALSCHARSTTCDKIDQLLKSADGGNSIQIPFTILNLILMSIRYRECGISVSILSLTYAIVIGVKSITKYIPVRHAQPSHIIIQLTKWRHKLATIWHGQRVSTMANVSVNS